MNREQMETILTLKGWRPAWYGIVWVGVYHDEHGLCYLNRDREIRIPEFCKYGVSWAPDWTVHDLPDKGKDILDITWQQIPAAVLQKLFNAIEKEGLK